MAEGADADAVLMRFVALIGAHHLDELEALLDPDAADADGVLLSPPTRPGGPLAGLRLLVRSFPDLRVRLVSAVSDDAEVHARLAFSGTMTAPFGPHEPLGRPLHWEVDMTLRCVAGRITSLSGRSTLPDELAVHRRAAPTR